MSRKKKNATYKRRQIKKSSCRLIKYAVMRGDIEITEALMKSITSPSRRSEIAVEIIKRKVDPLGSLRRALSGGPPNGYCFCENIRPMASQWTPPLKWRHVREVALRNPGRIKIIEGVLLKKRPYRWMYDAIMDRYARRDSIVYMRKPIKEWLGELWIKFKAWEQYQPRSTP